MTLEGVVNLLDRVENVFPGRNAYNDITATIREWGILFQPFSDHEANEALTEVMRSSKYPPTPGAIIEAIEATPERHSKYLALYKKFRWAMANASLGEQTWKQLPGEVQEYLGSVSEMKAMSKYCDVEEFERIKPKFVQQMASITRREATRQAMLPAGEVQDA